MDKNSAGAVTDRFKLLYEISKEINSSLEIDTVLNTVMDKIVLLMKAERGFIMLKDTDAGDDAPLTFRVARDSTRENATEEEFLVSKSIVDQVVTNNQPVLTFSALDDPRFSSSKSIVAFGLRSIMCVPMVVKGRLIGVIYVDNRMKAGVFKQEDLELLETFSHLAGIAIENARLFAELRRRINEQEAIFESVSSGIVSVDMAGRVTTFNRAAERMFGFPREHVLALPEPPLFKSAEGNELMAMIVAVAGLGESITGREMPYTSPDRHDLTLNLNLSPLRNLRDEQIGVAMVADDVTEKARYETVKNLFGRFVSPQVMDELTRDTSKVQLGGQEKTVTILFSDINDFTPSCERLPPAQIIDMLNDYFREMNQIIFQHGGTIKQFVGDEIMVMYGAPGAQSDHALRAVRTAVAMIKRLREMEDAQAGRAGFYRIKIGINTGQVVVGIVGSEERSEYAAVGDTVNLASRIQGLNKPLGTSILISESTYREVAEAMQGEAEFIERGAQSVKGKQDATTVFEVRPLGA